MKIAKNANPDQHNYDSVIYLTRRLFKVYVKAESSNMIICMICMLIIACTTALNAWLMQPVLDDIFVKKKMTLLYPIAIIIVLNGLVKGMASFFQSATMKIIGQRIIASIQLNLYKHLINADMKFLMNYPSGNLISRFTNDINAMRKSISDVVTGLILEMCTLVGLISIMFYQSFRLAVISTFILPLAFYPIRKLGRRMRKIARGMQEELGGFTVRLDETFQNSRIIKSYCREDYEISRANSIIERFLALYKKAAYVESASSPIMETLGIISVAMVILYGGTQVFEAKTTPGAFFSFITALLLAYKPLKSVSQLNTSLQEGLAACKRLFMMMDEEITIKDTPYAKEVTFKSYNIRFNKVNFSYNNGQKILDCIDMFIPQGKTTALVGTSGSGKSTIFNLMQRLYEADSGDITIDKHNINDIKLHPLRSTFALVSQEVALFDDTIWENIRYGKLDATDEEIIDAALAAAAHDFITSLPNGYNTQIGQHGAKLSGGQRQRIAIARAILKNSPVLLLDEATSALDTISEKQVQMALEYLKRGRTTIVIAHRLSTIETADLIYLIEDGKVAEHGTHNELIVKNGSYAKLYEQYKNSKTGF
jgi:subfamily B ATP-binding cassette protein MsbA